MRMTGFTMWATFAAVTVGSAGCRDAHVHEAFFPDLNESKTRLALNVQAARGARVDATLYGMHFDGTELNSLGQAKLGLMLEDGNAASPITVYVSVAADDADARRAAVERYLTDAGLEQGRFKTIAGVNPHNTHPASESITRLKKTESPQAEQSAEATSQADAGGTATSTATTAQ